MRAMQSRVGRPHARARTNGCGSARKSAVRCTSTRAGVRGCRIGAGRGTAGRATAARTHDMCTLTEQGETRTSRHVRTIGTHRHQLRDVRGHGLYGVYSVHG